MTRYAPAHQPFHDKIAAIQECTCDPAWKDRGMVDSQCWFHNLIDAYEDLVQHGVLVEDTGNLYRPIDDPDIEPNDLFVSEPTGRVYFEGWLMPIKGEPK